MYLFNFRDTFSKIGAPATATTGVAARLSRVGFILVACTFLYLPGMTQSATSVSAKTAKQWVEHGTWRNDLTVKPDPSINAQTFYLQYHKHQDWWDKAMAFLNRSDLATLAVGNYPIVGQDVFAAVSEYVPKDIEKSQWESHRKYADIQAVITGVEKIGKADASKLTVTKPYSEAADGANYLGSGKYYVAKPGTFFIFFPGDAHRPGLKVHPGDTAQVKKLVIKMRVD